MESWEQPVGNVVRHPTAMTPVIYSVVAEDTTPGSKRLPLDVTASLSSAVQFSVVCVKQRQRYIHANKEQGLGQFMAVPYYLLHKSL